MNSDPLRMAIAEVVWASRPKPGGAAFQPGGVSTADAILAMPEMQALLAKDAEIERLRAAGDALAKQITKPCRCVEAHDGAINETCAPCAAFFDWQEVRRG